MNARMALHSTTHAHHSAGHLPRVTVLGAGGAASSALADAIAEHYGTVCVPEYTRMYLMDKAAVGAASWWPEEFAHIARTQNRIIEEAERGASGILVSHTDAFSVWVWHRAHVAHPLKTVRGIAEQSVADLYILVRGDAPALLPHEVDAARRSRLHDMYVAELRAFDLDYVEVEGSEEERLSQAVVAIDQMLHAQTRSPSR